MSPQAYLLGFWSTPAFVVIAIMISASYGNNITAREMPWLGLGPLITYVVFIRKVWRSLDTQKGRPNPDEALLLFVPIFNMFWQYRVLYPIGRALQEDAAKLNRGTRRVRP